MSENQGEKRGTVVMRRIRFLCRVKETKKERRRKKKRLETSPSQKREQDNPYTNTYTLILNSNQE